MTGLDPAKLQDSNLRPIAEKVLKSQRLEAPRFQSAKDGNLEYECDLPSVVS